MYVFRILSQNAILFFNLKKGKARPISSVLFWNFVLGNPTNVLSPLSPCAHTDHVSGTLEFSKALNRLGENMIVRDDEPDDVGAAFQKFAVVTKELANLMKNMVGSIPLQQYPTTTCGGMQNGSSVEICTRFIHVFCTFGVDWHAQSVLINKISASELSRKFIKCALLVGEGECISRNIFLEVGGGGSLNCAAPADLFTQDPLLMMPGQTRPALSEEKQEQKNS